MSKTTKSTADQTQNAVANSATAQSGSESAYGVGGQQNQNTTGASAFALPHVNQALGTLREGYDASKGILDQYTPQISGGFEHMLSNYGKADPNLTASNNYANSTLGGAYLNGNGFLQQALTSAGNDARDMTNASVGARGAAGGSMQANLLSRNISNAQNNVLFQNYQNERQQQTAAAQIAAMNSQAQNNKDSSSLQQLMSMLAMPQAMAGQYASGVNQQVGNYTTNDGSAQNYTLGGSQSAQQGTNNTTGTQTTHGTNTTTESGGLLGSILGGLAGAVRLSDPRTKKDVVKLGEEPDGLGVYEFRYIWHGAGTAVQRGVMANEVAKLRPWALGPVRDGYATVDYSKLMEAA